ncbi:MAG: hypothetical protein HKN23_20040, partial [Verrucomicrobiales bacterium]|nr:hypothetical protein [Verrucomicrobiales bacterium]
AMLCNNEIPEFKPRSDDSPEDAAANRRDGEEYLSMVKEAAGDASIIAEDLGLVPDYVRPSLAGLEIAGMKIPQWEFTDGSVTPGCEYPPLSFAAYATHDHAPMKAQWDDNVALLKSAEPQSPDWWEAHNFFKPLCDYAGLEFDPANPPEYTDDVRESLLKAIFESRSKDVAILISDLFGLEERINVPGVMDGTNWAWRLDMTVQELEENPHWAYLTRRISRLLKDSGRA